MSSTVNIFIEISADLVVVTCVFKILLRFAACFRLDEIGVVEVRPRRRSSKARSILEPRRTGTLGGLGGGSSTRRNGTLGGVGGGWLSVGDTLGATDIVCTDAAVDNTGSVAEVVDTGGGIE